MPQLSPDMAQQTAEAEGGNFEPVPEGVYTVALECDVEVAEGPNGPYWKWTFVIPQGEEYAGKKFWTNTSLAEKALWKLNEVFTAFGVPTSTNTEDLVGRTIKVMVVQKVQEKGQNAGNLVNEIKQCLPANDGAASAPTAATRAPQKDDVPLY